MPKRLAAYVLLAVALMVVGAALAWWLLRPRLTEEAIRETVMTTIQREAPASFLVTGQLDLMATTTVANTKYFLPNVLDFDLGTTQATVRMPGRVSYGFDVRQLRPEMIDLGEDGLVRVTLPALTVFSVEPDLSAMEVDTDVGWARMHVRSGRRVEHRAIRLVRDALAKQGAAHVRAATEPRVNTARALQHLLTPVLQAAGLPEPRFQFQIGPELVMAPDD